MVALRLRQLRVRQGLSQEALAVDAGLDRTYVSGIERVRENPTVSVLERLALALNVEIGAFFVPFQDSEAMPKPLKPGRRRTR